MVSKRHVAKIICHVSGDKRSTVNQYVKTAIKKLGTKNRAQSVTELFRKGRIS